MAVTVSYYLGGALTDRGSCRWGASREVSVQLIGIIAVAAASTHLLASCSGSDYSKTPWMAHDQQCEKLGFKRGTEERVKCRLELARLATPRGSAPAAPD